MDKPIGVGDLVMVVRPAPCCGNAAGAGTVFRVESITDDGHCLKCAKYPLRGAWPRGVIMSRLKRIPPFPELADERHDEEITA